MRNLFNKACEYCERNTATYLATCLFMGLAFGALANLILMVK